MIYLIVIGAVMVGCLLTCLKESSETAVIYGQCALCTFVVSAIALYAAGVIGA